MNIKYWLKKNTYILSKNNNNNAQKEAVTLLSFVIKKPLSWIMAFDETLLTKKQIYKLNNFIKRRIIGEPIAYIIKECYFWSIKMSISNKAMIPRLDSEILIEKTLELIKPSSKFILDLGCGCGSLTLALAKEKPNCIFFGIDYIHQLILLARKNAKKLNIKNVFFINSNWFTKLNRNKFDIIISNPPYIDIKDPHLLIGDLQFEPLTALVADDNGLYNIKLIARSAANFINKSGWIIFEHGWKQGLKTRNILKENNFTNIFTNKDYNNCDRITGGMKNI